MSSPSKYTKPIYGNRPKDLGLIDLDPKELLLALYLPIKLPYGALAIPQTFRQFNPIISAVRDHLTDEGDLYKWDHWTRSYIYLTAKTCWVNEGNPGNRPGWHSDGFLTDDLNFIWYNMNPTVFWEPTPKFTVGFTADHQESLKEMDTICNACSDTWTVYPDKHLLLLDQTVLHRVNPNAKAGFRTFVKVSVSDQIYALERNSINHMLPEFANPEDYQPRLTTRNNPAGQHA